MEPMVILRTEHGDVEIGDITNALGWLANAAGSAIAPDCHRRQPAMSTAVHAEWEKIVNKYRDDSLGIDPQTMCLILLTTSLAALETALGVLVQNWGFKLNVKAVPVPIAKQDGVN